MTETVIFIARCEHETNECDSSPCTNGGVCADLLASFKCECPHGYTGLRCEFDIDDCVGDPCGQNARFVNCSGRKR